MHRNSYVDDSEFDSQMSRFQLFKSVKVIETALKCGTKKHSTRHLRDSIESAPGADTPGMPHREIKIE